MNLCLCPKCGGQGHVNKPPWIAGDQHTWLASSTASYRCPVCHGHGYLAAPDGQTEEQR